MEFYHKEPRAVLEDFHVDENQGLSTAQVNEREVQFGKNQLREKKKKTLFQRYIAQFKDILVVILILAAGISFFLPSKGRTNRVFGKRASSSPS